MDSSFVLIHSGCCNKTSHTGWLINHKYLFFTVLQASKPKIMVLVEVVFGSMEDGGKRALLGLFYRGTNPIHEVSILMI